MSSIFFILPSFFCFRKHLSLGALYKKKCVLCANHQHRAKPTSSQKCRRPPERIIINASMGANTTATPRIYGETRKFWVSSLGVRRRRKRSRGERFLTLEDLFFLVRILRVPRSFVRIVHTEVLFYYFYYDTNQFDLRVTQTASSGRNFPW